MELITGQLLRIVFRMTVRLPLSLSTQHKHTLVLFCFLPAYLTFTTHLDVSDHRSRIMFNHEHSHTRSNYFHPQTSKLGYQQHIIKGSYSETFPHSEQKQHNIKAHVSREVFFPIHNTKTLNPRALARTRTCITQPQTYTDTTSQPWSF